MEKDDDDDVVRVSSNHSDTAATVTNNIHTYELELLDHARRLLRLQH